MKRKLAVLGLCFALAELAAATLPPPAAVPAALLTAGAALLLVICRRGRASAAVWVLAGLALGLGYSAGYDAAVVRPVEALAGSTVTATATVEPDCSTAYGPGMLRGTLRLEGIPGCRGAVLVQCWSFPAERAGERFTAQFALSALPKDRYRAGSYADGVYLEAEYLGGWAAQPSKSVPRFWMNDARLALSARLRRWMPQPYGPLAAAMLLADRSLLPADVTNAFRAAGVSHLLAVSGLHISLLCGVFALGAAAGGRRRFARPRILARAALILFYMALTGAPVSVRRAGVALLLALAGEWLLQPPDYLTAMGAAALLFGLQNAWAPCDVGFQLSFAAVLGVQAGAALARWERPRLPGWLMAPLAAVQTAAFASLATLPVLLANGMTASGVAVLSNLLVVWMLRPALLLGLAVLALSALPVLAPAMRAASLLLSVWLRGMLAIVRWCAALPAANVYLPRRYTLFVLAVLGALAVFFWCRRKTLPMLWLLPAAAVCGLAAAGLGMLLMRDVITVALVGTAGNPCAVITQNDRAAVLFRGGKTNLDAVEEYLAGHGAPEVLLTVDIRQDPQEAYAGDAALVLAEAERGWRACELSETLTLYLYHSAAGNLAVIRAGDASLALAAGSAALPQPLAVDVFCAGGSWPEGLSAGAVLANSTAPRLFTGAGGAAVYYGSEAPAAVLRPGRSLILEEVERLAVQ